MAEPEEQELIPAEAVQGGEAPAKDDDSAQQKPAEDDRGAESPHATEPQHQPEEQQQEQKPEEQQPEEEQPEEQQPEAEEQEQPQDQSEVSEQPAEEMAQPSGGAIVAATPEAPADIDEPDDEVAAPAPESDTKPAPATDMQALEINLTQFRHCIENIGTQLDDEMNRQEMRKLRADIREKATRMENDLKDRQKTKNQMEPQERVHLQQVIKQLEGQLNTYHELLERERSMTRRHPLVGIQLDDKESRIAANQAATPGQAQAMLKSNAKDRETEQVELMELERDIVGLQDIQTHLADLVGEQSDDIRLIEQHVERAGDRVEHGHHQMQQGVNYTRASRKMMCVVGTVVSTIAAALIILAIVILAVVLSQR